MSKDLKGVLSLLLLLWSGGCGIHFFSLATPRFDSIDSECFEPILHGKPVGYKPSAWSIAVVNAPSLEMLSAASLKAKSSLVAASVFDRSVRFVADPFMVFRNGEWYLFFEVMNCGSEQGDIGYATSSDGKNWRYRGIVLDEDFHLSYPHVFQVSDVTYMIPETRQGGGIFLYRADVFPIKWSKIQKLYEGDFADPSIFYHGGRWWIFAVQGAYSLAVLHAESLQGPWKAHALSPLYSGDKARTRPAGRVIVQDARIVRFAQDNRERYGHRVRAFAVSRLTPTEFAEEAIKPDPFLQPSGTGWNGVAMHHIDAHKLSDGTWMAAVDGAGSVNLEERR